MINIRNRTVDSNTDSADIKKNNKGIPHTTLQHQPDNTDKMDQLLQNIQTATAQSI